MDVCVARLLTSAFIYIVTIEAKIKKISDNKKKKDINKNLLLVFSVLTLSLIGNWLIYTPPLHSYLATRLTSG